MLLAMVDDIRVILVKLADRLHNMRTLHHLTEERRVRIAQETRDIYAPIAHRLGMSKLKNELEELAFRHIEPAAYQALRLQVEPGAGRPKAWWMSCAAVWPSSWKRRRFPCPSTAASSASHHPPEAAAPERVARPGLRFPRAAGHHEA